MYDTVKDLSGNSANRVLTQARLLLKSQNALAAPSRKIPLGHRWPKTKRRLRTRISTQAGAFWDNVTFQSVIDVEQFHVPSVSNVKFTFVDPVYVWLDHANLLRKNGHELHWTPQRLKNPRTGEDMYGRGVEFGLLLRAAKASIPACGRVALMNLSWDGGDTGYASRGATPICIQVMNVNSAATESVGLVAYLPQLDVSDAYRETDDYKRVYFYLLQVNHTLPIAHLILVITHLLLLIAHLIFVIAHLIQLFTHLILLIAHLICCRSVSAE